MNFSHFISHLEELRGRLLFTLAVFLLALAAGFFFAEPLITFLLRPLENVSPGGLVFHKPHEAFLIHVQTAVLFGLFAAIPVFLLQMWRFAAPGLYGHEKKIAVLIAGASVLLFGCGIAFAYGVAAPWGLKFLLDFQGPSLRPLLSAQDYFSFLGGMFAAFGLLFVFPVLVVGAVRLGVVTPEALARARRVIVVVILTAAAVLTPSPDPATQLLLALPLFLLFEAALWVSKRIRPRPKP